jgi:hypothetical protein
VHGAAAEVAPFGHGLRIALYLSAALAALGAGFSYVRNGRLGAPSRLGTPALPPPP